MRLVELWALEQWEPAPMGVFVMGSCVAGPLSISDLFTIGVRADGTMVDLKAQVEEIRVLDASRRSVAAPYSGRFLLSGLSVGSGGGPSSLAGIVLDPDERAVVSLSSSTDASRFRMTITSATRVSAGVRVTGPSRGRISPADHLLLPIREMGARHDLRWEAAPPAFSAGLGDHSSLILDCDVDVDRLTGRTLVAVSPQGR